MTPRFDFVSALQGLIVGLLTVLLFTIPPLLGIRHIRPALIFRREMSGPPAGLKVWWKQAAASVISAAVILAFVGLLAAWLSENAKTGVYFAVAMAAGLASLAAVAWALLRSLRVVSRHLPRSAGPVLRQGIANLYRPGNHAGAAVMALGVGVMFTVTVWIVQRGLLQDIVRTAPPGMPNVYLLDITAANRDAVYKLVSRQPGVEGTPEMLGAVSAQIQSIDGVLVRRENLRGVARRYARTVTVSPAPAKPAFTEVVAGRWWTPRQSHGRGGAFGRGKCGEASESPPGLDRRLDDTAAHIRVESRGDSPVGSRPALSAHRVFSHARPPCGAPCNLLRRNPRGRRVGAGAPEGGL